MYLAPSTLHVLAHLTLTATAIDLLSTESRKRTQRRVLSKVTKVALQVSDRTMI